MSDLSIEAASSMLRTATKQVRHDRRFGSQVGASQLRWPEAAALLAIAGWLALFWNGPLINDAGWHLWIGRQLNAGQRLYVDIMEVNPPLWFWAGAVVQRMAGAAGVPGLAMLVATFAACATAAVLLVRLLLPHRARERALIHAGLIVTLFLTSPFALAQREQFAFLTVIPYMVLIARRAEGWRTAPALAIAVALLAASGLALKHYFALVPIALEAWLLWRTRRFGVRPELAALALAAAGYVAAIVLLTPEFLTVMVPLNMLAYGGFGDAPFFAQMNQLPLLAAAFALLAMWVRRRQLGTLTQAATVITAAFVAIYFLQGKGFAYHAIPALGGALLCLLLAFGRAGGSLRLDGDTIAAAVALLAAIATPQRADQARYDQAGAKATASLPAGSSIIALSASGAAAWPLVEDQRLGWPSRHMTLWMLVPVWVAMEGGELTPELEQLGRNVTAEVARDIACSRPSVILVDGRYDLLAGTGGVLGYFARDPAFVRAMQGYERVKDVDYLQVYRLSEPAEAATDAPCSRVRQPLIAR